MKEEPRDTTAWSFLRNRRIVLLDLLAGLLFTFIFVTFLVSLVTLLLLFGCGELALRGGMVVSFIFVRVVVLSSSCTTRNVSCWLFAMSTLVTQVFGRRSSCSGLLVHLRPSRCC